MPTYTQDGRFMAITTPLGKDMLLIDTFAGTEAISQLFHFRLGMYAEAETKVGFDQLLGQKVTVTFQGDTPRYFNGIISRLSQGQRVKGLNKEAAMVRFDAEMVPQLWLLTKNVQSRIFQQKSVPDILKLVLKGLDLSSEIQGTFEPRDYCVQYRESDFDFASRLMEEEGIYYFFKHTASGHQLVLADTPQSHPDVPGPSPIKYEEIHGAAREDERINEWIKSQEIRTAKQTLRDHCFELPNDNLEAAEPIAETIQAGTISHKLKTGANASLENYDFPGRYAQRFDGIDPGGASQAANLQKIFQDNKRTARIRIQEEAAPGLVIEAHGDCRLLTAGYKFTLDGHFDADGPYVVTEVTHAATIEGSYTQLAGSQSAPVYTNSIRCIPAALPYRPQRRTPKVRVDGTQTAVVVGPQGDEIFTDKYGRVKVQFFWDRQGKKDASSSCWIRVGTLWGGKQWGGIHIPRIGQEVIVAFEEGDPDQPIIVGSVYNADQMPPYALPANKTQSGLKSRSSLKGGADDFNELRLEDKKGSEEIYFHAQKDFNRVVENNDTLKVGSSKADDGSQTIEIWKDRTETVKTGNEKVTIEKGNRDVIVKTGNDAHLVEKGNREVTVKTGNDTHVVETGNREVTVKTGNDTHKVQTGNRDIQIDMGNDSMTIKMGNQTTKLNLGASSTEAMQSIELKVGQSSVKVDQMGVTIEGMMIKINGQVQTQVQGLMTQVSGSAMTQISGGITMIG
ncbi:MAG TPA: type VI secretion system tip protein TssI/VgrG [Gemmataceae bacterium]|jgi:type VI secretion system secreted protein VgrG|nr:type VI secretion system tip protein TssI/VgrG [Gemmataceae bacterium]